MLRRPYAKPNNVVRATVLSHHTIKIFPDYIQFVGVTAKPAGATTGCLWYRVDVDRIYYQRGSEDVYIFDSADYEYHKYASPLDHGDSVITSSKLVDGCVLTRKIADRAVTGIKIALSAISTEHIVDSAITDSKIKGPISPAKIGEGDLNIGTGILTCGGVDAGGGTVKCGAVQVGDIQMRLGWAITESEDGLILMRNGIPVLKITENGIVPLRTSRKRTNWIRRLLRRLYR